MCDYSLESVASRPAKVGDRLVSSRFTNAITRGFAAADEPDVAVCLLPGTELAFDDDISFDGTFAFRPLRTLTDKVARFRHINESIPNMHHDALETADGTIVLLTQLCLGQHATVLQLPAEDAPARRHEEERAGTPVI